MACLVTPAGAQTLTSGLLHGVVRDGSDAPLGEARVAVRETTTGIVHDVRTDREGRFGFRLLPPGEYEVFAEKLGYRPQRVVAVPLRPGRTQDVSLVLIGAEPPVNEADTVVFAAAGAGWSRAGSSRWLGELEVQAPRDRQGPAPLASLASMVDERFSIGGLPASLSRVSVEGFTFRPLSHPHRADEAPRSPQAVRALQGAELITHLTDVEWSDAASGHLVGYSRRGTADFGLRVWGSGADPDFALGRFSADRAGSYDLWHGGGELSGPIVPDTASFMIGGEWRRRAVVQPRAWRADELAGVLTAAAARDSAGLTLRALTLPWIEERDEFSGYGRFDWRIATDHDLSVFADMSAYRTPPVVSAVRATPVPGIGATGFDAVGGAALRSVLGPRFANEVRAGLARSSREYALPEELDLAGFGGSGIPATQVLAGGLLFGDDAAGPGTFERTTFRLDQALLVALGDHVLKAGLTFEWDAYDQVYAFGRTGRFAFGDAGGFATRTGLFEQRVGSLPAASFSVLETGAILQDTWTPASGLELTGGVRIVDERLPGDRPTLDSEWLLLTGLRNDSIDTRVRQISPRLGFRWDVRERHRWIVRGGIGLFHDDIAPELLAERMTHDGGVRVRRGLGDLGSWPSPPDSVAASVQGASLTLFGPDFRAPRSTRASFGISRHGTTSLHLSTSYRHTDFLPVRRDLNRSASISGRDQYGRALFGETRQLGALLAVEPGSNRRFADFDIVSSVEATGFSDYWNATMLLERRVGRALRFAASYTYSQTRDNWLSHPGVAPQDGLIPQLSDSATAGQWAEGVSDFDVPHRLSVAAELSIPWRLRPTVGVVYRLRSGYAFTPGFRPGVDANGDYASNDPAWVDDALPGMDSLLGEWDCLREQTGGFAERNSCRGDPVQFLDLRFGLDVGGPGRGARLFFDALNVLGAELAEPDRALYLIDADAQLARDDATGTVTVPLNVNPDFGRPLRPLAAGRVFKLGVEVVF